MKRTMDVSGIDVVLKAVHVRTLIQPHITSLVAELMILLIFGPQRSTLYSLHLLNLGYDVKNGTRRLYLDESS